MLKRTVAVTCWILAASCIPFFGGSEPEGPAVAAIEIVNRNPHSAEVYRMADGTRILLGTVAGGSAATLGAPIPPSRQMSIEVRLAEVGSYRSWAVVASPRTPIRLEIPADLHLIHGRFD